MRAIALSAVVALTFAGCSDPGEGDDPLRADFEWDYDLTQTEGTACGFSTTYFFDDSAGEPESWLWEFPDGSTSTEEDPVIDTSRTRVVPESGIADMTVTLTVSRGGFTSSASHEVFPVHC